MRFGLAARHSNTDASYYYYYYYYNYTPPPPLPPTTTMTIPMAMTVTMTMTMTMTMKTSPPLAPHYYDIESMRLTQVNGKYQHGAPNAELGHK